MRNAFCNALVDLAAAHEFAFLTGDLGFMALEPLQAAMGDRFINAGVAEANLISVAAGTASGGLPARAYSIAPFVYARPFEQIRNDVCLHDLDVKLVGNGGGYGYGVMGATHHAIEDYGVMAALQHMRVYVPAFAADVAPAVARMAGDPHPSYLRLGRDEAPKDAALPPYAPGRKLLDGATGVLVVVGPGAGPVLAEAMALSPAERPEVWALSELPMPALPADLLASIAATGTLFVLEEHVAQGSVGQMLAHSLLLAGAAPRRFEHFHAHGYRSGRYGSQGWHRRENGIDAPAVLAAIR